eukprot:jgi/Psemu1/69709/estExt_Genemark1.C_10020003
MPEPRDIPVITSCLLMQIMLMQIMPGCDNDLVVKNTMRPESPCKKQHNIIAYHKARECIAGGSIQIAKEPGKTNIADLLTKLMSGARLIKLAMRCMWRNNGDAVETQDGRTTAHCPLKSIIYEYEYEHERCLVAWVLLTRLSQEHLDRAWEKHGNTLSNFASSLLAESDTDLDRRSISNDNVDDSNLLDVCYIRLVTQVTARLTPPPSESLKQSISTAWKCALANVANLGKVVSEQSAASTTASIETVTSVSNPPVVALSIDVCNAFAAWMEQDDNFALSQCALNDVWNGYMIAYETGSKSFARGKERKYGNACGMGQSESSECRDRDAMISVLESILGPTIDTWDRSNADETNANDDFYTIGNLERLVITIFELQDTKNNVSEEILDSVLQWIAKRDWEDIFTPDLRTVWHGWLMINVEKCLSKKKKKHSALLRDPKAMDVMQTILMAHAVSPEAQALRPVAWQCMAQIVRTYGWSWGKVTSKSAPICIWCRLACGEWKIQLEEEGDPASAYQSRMPILDGCGTLMIGVVQYLVDFDERPDKRIPLDHEGLLHVRESLEETLVTTSAYLNHPSIVCDGTGYSMVINLWSQLCAEVDLSTMRGAENVIRCLQKLLLVSNDESLLQALVHVISTAQIEAKVLQLVGRLESGMLDSIVVYLDRFWKKITNANYLTRNQEHDHIHWACVAVEMLMEHKIQTIDQLTDSMLKAIAYLVEYLQTAPPQKGRDNLLSSLQLLLDSYMAAFEKCDGTTSTNKESLILSSAIRILEKT